MATEPGEAALHNPGEACNLERALTAFDDLQLPAGLPQQVARELATLVSGISDNSITVRMFGNNGSKPLSNRAAAFRSEMSAGSTLHAMSSPKVSTRMWRLRPFTRLCASNPRIPPRSAVFTDWLSMMTTDGQAARAALLTAFSYIERWS